MKKYSLSLPVFSLLLLAFFSFSSPDQLFKTSLRLTILNELGNPVEGAKVTLYNSLEDYRQEENPVSATEMTDDKGRVKFSDLEPKVYFVEATKDNMSNAGAGVQTDTLQENRMNKINIIIE